MLKAIVDEIPFNINIVYNNQKINPFYRIHKIFILKANNKLFSLMYTSRFQKYLFHCFSQINILNLKSNMLFHYYITYLQKLGFIRSIDYKYIILDKNQYIWLKLYVNPLIKKIKIDNYNSLIIPTTQLKKLLYPFLGLPKNYFYINSIIQKINWWYQSRGFKWIKIHVIKTTEFNNIYFHIDEGKIFSSKIICIYDSAIPTYNSQLNNKIFNELSLKKGTILNKIILETKIRQIKKKYSIKSLKYEIFNKKNGIHINVKYKLNLNNNKQIYYQILYRKHYISNLLKCKIHYIKFKLSLFLKNYLRYFNEYTLYYVIYLQIKYNIYHLLKIYIHFPQIQLYKYIFVTCYLSYNYVNLHSIKSIIHNNYYFTKVTNFHLQEKWNIANLSIIKIITTYKLNKFFCISYKVKNWLCDYKKYFIIIYTCRNDSNIKFLKLIENFYLFSINYQVKFYTQLFTLLPKLKNSLCLTIEYNFFIFYKMHTYHYNNKSIKYLFHQLLNYEIKNFFNFQFSTNIKNNISFYFQSNILNYSLQHICLLRNKFNKSKIFNNNKPIYCLLKFQYMICHNKYNNCYFFIKQMIIFSQKDDCFYNNHFSKNTNKNYSTKYFRLGVGSQLNIPIKQIPYIRLEYIINLNKKLYLFIDQASI